jgi:ribosomal protein S18 acetylase RimI-like enzyme
MSTPFSSELQRIASTGWGFVERAYIGEWELRASGGFTTRANSAWPVGDPGRPVAEAVDAVRAWYAERGLPARIAVVAGSDLDGLLAGLGLPGAESPAFRQVADIGKALEVLGETPDGARPVEFAAELPDDYFAVYRRGQGHDGARQVLSSGGANLTFAVIRDNAGAPLAVGRLAVDPASGYAGVAAIHTAEPVRRQGLSSTILRALLRSAHDGGARTAYLEVETTNVPALTLYGHLGFVTEHCYHSRVEA